MVRTGEIDNPNHSLNHTRTEGSIVEVPEEVTSDGLERFSDSDPDPDPSEGEAEADADADAEGESEVALSLTIGSEIVAAHPFTASIRSGHITPLRSVINRDVSGSSQSSISPVSSLAGDQSSHQMSIFNHPQTQWAPTNPGSNTIFQLPYKASGKGPSTKSSYSSLSAVSNLIPHSRSTSGSMSLRSISSSSSTAPQIAGGAIPIDPRLVQLKRPAPAESFARSSRSRVEDILSENEEPATWVEGHIPTLDYVDGNGGGGFHIGSEPTSLPYIPYDAHVPLNDDISPSSYSVSQSTDGFNGDLTPYMMAPDAWSTNTPFVYLPHISNTGVGEFEMPPEYDFTFTQEPINTIPAEPNSSIIAGGATKR